MFASLTISRDWSWRSLLIISHHPSDALFRLTLDKWFSITLFGQINPNNCTPRMEIWFWSAIDNWIFQFPSSNHRRDGGRRTLWTNEVCDPSTVHLEHEPAKNNQRLSPLPGAFHQCQGQQSCPPLNDKALIWVPGLFHCARSRGPTQVSSAMQRLALQSS